MTITSFPLKSIHFKSAVAKIVALLKFRVIDGKFNKNIYLRSSPLSDRSAHTVWSGVNTIKMFSELVSGTSYITIISVFTK